MSFKRILLLALIQIPVLTQAQEIKLFAEVHYGTYSMKSLREFLMPPENYYIDLKVVDDFPAFVGFKTYGTIQVSKNFATGVFVGFNTTGGKATYSDYSGSANYEIACKGLSIGALSEVTVYRFGSYEVSGTFLTGVILNKTNLSAETDVQFYETYSEDFKSTNIMFNPGACITRQSGSVFLRGFASYEFNFAGDLTSKEDGDYLLNIDKPVRAQWDGLRVGISIGVVLNGKSKTLDQ